MDLAKRLASAVPPIRRVVEERDALRRELDAARRPRGDCEYLFVMTYGRSGSTLLQAILNSTPGYLIRGENRGIAYHLHQFHQSASKDAAWVGDRARRKVHPFFGIRDYPADVALQDIRRLLLDTVLRPGPRTRVVGFKEIRWYQEDLADYVRFLTEVFPGARFVVNTRRLVDVAQSSWWANQPDALEKLETIESRILSVAETLGASSYRVHYDEYAERPARLAGLFEWLGEEFDEKRVREVMEQQRYAQISATPDPERGAS